MIIEHLESWIGWSGQRWRPIRWLLAATGELAGRWSAVLALVVSIMITFALYGQALSLSYFFDDTFDLTRVEGRSFFSLLTSSEGYSYYRPVPFLIWKLVHHIAGYYPAPVLHALPLLAHAVAGWLVFMLLRRMGSGYWAAVPAILFLTFPFSYQDVLIVGVVFHPLAAMFMLASALLYIEAHNRQEPWRRRLHLAALAATVGALWTHESGVAVIAFLIAVEIYLVLRDQRNVSRWLLPHAGALVLFVLTYLLVDKQPVAETVEFSGLHPKLLFYMQALSYPLSAQIEWLDHTIGFAPGILETFVLTVAVTIGIPVWLLWRRREKVRESLLQLRFVILSVLAIGAISAPVMLRLSWPYVEDAPRLLYVVGLGAAVLWGLVPALTFRNQQFTTWWRAVTTILLGIIVVQSVVFIDRRVEMFQAADSAVDGLVAAGERYPNQEIVVVNMPAWLAQSAYEYPMGHLGAQVTPSYIGLERVIYAASRHQVQIVASSVAFNPPVTSDTFTFGPHALSESATIAPPDSRAGPVVFEVVRDGEDFRVVEVGRFVRGGADDVAAGNIDLGPAMAMSNPRLVVDDRSVQVYLSWLVHAASIEPFTVEIRAIDIRGQVIAQRVSQPLAGTTDMSLWTVADRIDDGYWLGGLASGGYTIQIGRRSTVSEQLLAPGYFQVGSVMIATEGSTATPSSTD